MVVISAYVSTRRIANLLVCAAIWTVYGSDRYERPVSRAGHKKRKRIFFTEAMLGMKALV